MTMIVVGLARNAEQARRIARALEDDGLAVEQVAAADLVSRGVPSEEADLYAEGVRRGGIIVLVPARDAAAAARAAQTMAVHGAADIDACASGWRRQPDAGTEEYAVIFGEYPAAPGRIYHDPRSTV